MGQMSSAIAHELNQPLTAIVNFVKAARRTLDSVEGPKAARAQELIDKAAAQTQRAGAIIKNLREFIEKREGNRMPESLNKVVQEAIALGFVGAKHLNVKVRLDLDPGLPPVLIDKIQMQQVLINLIRNGVEAMQTVATRELSVTTASDDPGHVQITVRDTGTGLAPEVAKRLFQPFVTTKSNGMGIGLTICQSIVDAHGGRISTLEGISPGTAFRIRLPTYNRGEVAA